MGVGHCHCGALARWHFRLTVDVEGRSKTTHHLLCDAHAGEMRRILSAERDGGEDGDAAPLGWIDFTLEPMLC